MRYIKQFKENIKDIKGGVLQDIAKTGIKIAKNKINQNKNERILTTRYSEPLKHYSTLMGRVNYDKAMGEVKRYVKSGDYNGANNYVNDQINKINKEISN